MRSTQLLHALGTLSLLACSTTVEPGDVARMDQVVRADYTMQADLVDRVATHESSRDLVDIVIPDARDVHAFRIDKVAPPDGMDVLEPPDAQEVVVLGVDIQRADYQPLPPPSDVFFD